MVKMGRILYEMEGVTPEIAKEAMARIAQAALDHPAGQPRIRVGSLTMKASELKELGVEELTRKAAELRENLFNLKIRRRAGTLEATSDVTKNKRDLARILTLLTQKTGSSKAQRRSAEKSKSASGPASRPAARRAPCTSSSRSCTCRTGRAWRGARPAPPPSSSSCWRGPRRCGTWDGRGLHSAAARSRS